MKYTEWEEAYIRKFRNKVIILLVFVIIILSFIINCNYTNNRQSEQFKVLDIKLGKITYLEKNKVKFLNLENAYLYFQDDNSDPFLKVNRNVEHFEIYIPLLNIQLFSFDHRYNETWELYITEERLKRLE